MSPSSSKSRQSLTASLTYRDVKHIAYEMGWDPIDAAAFWRLAGKLNKKSAR